MRSSLLLGVLFLRNARAATRVLAVLVGAVAALALCALFGLVSFIGHVGAQGQQRDLGVPRDRGCIQGQDRYDPVGLSQYTRILVAATCSDPAVPPGLAHFPRPGEVFLSPALARLRSHNDRVATRFPRVEGMIGRSGLTGANDLYAIVGVQPITGALPVGVDRFDQFGSPADYIATYMRLSRGNLLVTGLFFTLLPIAYLIAASTRLNARTRGRQLELLSVIGLDDTCLRRALMWETATSVGAGAVLGVVTASAVLPRITPTFVVWKAFPGDFSPNLAVYPLAVALVTVVALGAASWGARTISQRTRRTGRRPSARSRGLGYGVYFLGITGAIATFWLHAGAGMQGSGWPVVLVGRLCTFLGLLTMIPLLCAWVGSRASRSPDPITSLIGARLRRPAGSLTRSLAALVAGLYVLSAGATTISVRSPDPAAIAEGYATDGYRVIEVRRPSPEADRLLRPYELLAGTNTSSDPALVGTLSGSCATVRHAVGDKHIDCELPSFVGTTDGGQKAPPDSGVPSILLQGPRAEYFSGFAFTITAEAKPRAGDDDIFVPLPVSRADHLYDTLVGQDPSVNVRVVDAADASGATELGGILGIFRWGAAFAAAAALVASLISLVALLLDRQAGNSYLQTLGLTRRQTIVVAVAEVMTAAVVATAAALVGSWFWAMTIRGDRGSASLITVAWPFVAALVVLAILATALTVLILRADEASAVPDRDGLVAQYDVADM